MVGRNALTLSGLTVLAGLPAALALSYYLSNGTAWNRPLSLSRDGGTTGRFSAGSGSALKVLALVRWDDTRIAQGARSEFTQLLSYSFAARGTDMRIVFDNAPGQSGSVRYKVGGSVIGPYSISQAARGIGAATDALRMTERARIR